MSTASTTPSIRCSGVSKKFARSLKRAMWYGTVDIARAALIPHRFRSDGLDARVRDGLAVSGHSGQPALEDSDLRPSEFWALRDVSFDVQPGECIGLIGHNGAGKSTLFSILSGIYGPTGGSIEIRGRLQALIALGAGFHPMLSGRENIYINASILGMKTRQIDALADQIVAFAELGDFIDSPVKNYSSGMMVRLGFSVAAHLDPDVLLVDEVLAVGDVGFQMKCHDFTRRLLESGKTVMLVSHYMGNIQGLCSRCVWLDHGRVTMQGPVEEVTGAYSLEMTRRAIDQAASADQSLIGYPAVITKVELEDDQGAALAHIESSQPVRLRIQVESSVDIPSARFYVQFMNAQLITIVGASMFVDGRSVSLRRGRNTIAIRFAPTNLSPGMHMIRVGVRNQDSTICLADTFATRPLEVKGDLHLCLNPAENPESMTSWVWWRVKVPYQWETGADP